MYKFVKQYAPTICLFIWITSLYKGHDCRKSSDHNIQDYGYAKKLLILNVNMKFLYQAFS